MRTLDQATKGLMRAIARDLAGPVLFGEVASTPWASGTFSGSRHRIEMRINGLTANETARCFADGLEERDFPLSGHILADINLVEIELGVDQVRIVIEALTVEEA